MFNACACWKHSNFLKVFCKIRTHGTAKYNGTLQNYAKTKQYTHPAGGPVALGRCWTTSILTAATLIYTIGAGITAAAGTRLALQLILIMDIKFGSFQLQDNHAVYCYLLSLPPCVTIGQFARLLPSLDVVAVSHAPSPESNPNFPSPVIATVSKYHTVRSW